MSAPTPPQGFPASWPRILLVTGKGGVGKTTVAATLANQAAGRGERTILVETSGARVAPGLFGRPSEGYAPVVMAPRLSAISITPEAAFEDYVLQQIKVRRLYKLVFENRIMSPFVEAVPGLHDALQLGKVMDLERDTHRGTRVWDRIIVDAPATGHGLTMMGAARAMMDLTRAGPMFEGLRQVHAVLDDPAKTGLVLVALPEEMPVNETLDLWEQLGDSRAQVRLCVLNQVHPRLCGDQDWAAASAHLQQLASPAVAEAMDLVARTISRSNRQEEAHTRLAAGLTVPVVDLPTLTHGVRSRDDLESLGQALSEALR